MSKAKYSQIAIEALTEYKNNARTHSSEQVAKIARSIQEFGFINPVLINAEKAAAEKAAAEKAAAEKAAATKWELSDREKQIIKDLSRKGQE